MMRIRYITMTLVAAIVGFGWASVSTAQALKVVETDTTITVTRGENAVLTYNKTSPPAPTGIDPVFERSGFLHPVVSPKGRVVTGMFPIDHPHQQGIFTAWVKTKYDGRPVDFWNLADKTGRVLHERVVSVSDLGDGGVRFEVVLLHRAVKEPAIDVLRERWKVTVYPTDATYRCFDLELTQTALTDKPLIVEKNRYGGVALRGPLQWLSPQDKGAGDLAGLQPCTFLNDLGSDRAKGNDEHARWVAMTGSIDGGPVTIAVLSHPGNFRAPQAARLHPTKPYFCFSPCVDDAFRIDREHPYHARYRYLITDAKPDATWLNAKWTKWAGE